MKFIKSIIKKLLALAGSLYYRLRSADLIRRHVLNRSAIRLYHKYPANLSAAEKSAAESLRDTGLAIAHISDFFPPAVLNELTVYANQRWKNPQVQEKVKQRDMFMMGDKKIDKNFFLIELWDGEYVLDLNNSFLKLSLSSPILNVVNSYLEMLAKFRHYRLQVTIPMPEDMRAYASQQWHRDPEDKKMVRVFLYLNDVDESAGPFTYLRYSHMGGKHRRLFPQHPPRGTYKLPADVDRFIPKDDVKVCTGKAGTIIFCDTSGLHRGGLAKSNKRFMYTNTYTAPASVWPIRYSYPENLETSSLSPTALYAIQNDPNQREPKYH